MLITGYYNIPENIVSRMSELALSDDSRITIEGIFEQFNSIPLNKILVVSFKMKTPASETYNLEFEVTSVGQLLKSNVGGTTIITLKFPFYGETDISGPFDYYYFFKVTSSEPNVLIGGLG